MSIPLSTYRIQLHKDFTFRNLQRILDYLHTLGISTVYASPILQATPGSMHGYDVTDPHAINVELGDAEEFRSLIKDIRRMNMEWLQDIVPNHMAFHPANHRLMDVLERGSQSPYYRFFDIDWDHPHPDLKGKVMVPFLGMEPDECIRAGEIKLSFGEEGFKVNYLGTAYPLSLAVYPVVASFVQDANEGSRVRSTLSKMAAVANGVDLETWLATKLEYVQAVMQDPSQVEAVQNMIGDVNNNSVQLTSILDLQYYRLSYWKETDRRINYRRFFTVNELICLRMEDQDVFDEYHAYLFRLFKDKLIDGFRIDHIDGLYDPASYTKNLRALTGEGPYLIAEKILESREDMPAQWPIQGTSGYEFLSATSQLLTNRKGARELLSFYKDLVPGMLSYRELIHANKRLILQDHMGGEWDNLMRDFQRLGLSMHFREDRLKSALGLFMLALPVYRIYPDSLPLKGKALVTIHEAFNKAVSFAGDNFAEELSYLRTLFTSPPETPDRRHNVLSFLKRLMQFTGPLTAKGVEDTTFYIYNPLISHDEVGDSPASLGMSVQRFHEKMQLRQSTTPLSLNATATHDTKRGEDARVRINVLSRIPGLWKGKVAEWFDMNEPFKSTVNGSPAPAVNDEYFIYQSMLGSFPPDYTVTGEWVARIKAYLNKSLREAKVNTSWSDPDEQYEKSCERFVERILDTSHRFLPSFVSCVKTVVQQAMIYSLSQTLIKLTAPGIPDIYQGCELWDLSFVDPDNRRPVDYEKRMEFLFQLVVKEEKASGALFDYLADHRGEGIEKLYVIRKTLNFRKNKPHVFTQGEYIPISITGSEVVAAAYARRNGDEWVIAIFPLGEVTHDSIDHESRTKQFLVLPEDAPLTWTNLFTGERFETPNQISLGDVFRNFPVALLVNVPSSEDRA